MRRLSPRRPERTYLFQAALGHLETYVDLPVFARGEHPVDHAAVKRGKQGCRNAAPRKVNMSIQPRNLN